MQGKTALEGNALGIPKSRVKGSTLGVERESPRAQERRKKGKDSFPGGGGVFPLKSEGKTKICQIRRGDFTKKKSLERMRINPEL